MRLEHLTREKLSIRSEVLQEKINIEYYIFKAATRSIHFVLLLFSGQKLKFPSPCPICVKGNPTKPKLLAVIINNYIEIDNLLAEVSYRHTINIKYVPVSPKVLTVVK